MPAEEIRVSARYRIAGTTGSVPLPPPKRLRTETLKTGSYTQAVLTSTQTLLDMQILDLSVPDY